MKILYHPSFGSATEPRAPADGSDELNISLLSETETLRVLEVRPPTRAIERADAPGYAVRIEERLHSEQQPLTLVQPEVPAAAPRAPVMKPAAEKQKMIPAPPPAAAHNDAFKDFSKDAFEIEDLSRTTGVRHLRIEVQRRARPPAKRSKPQRKG